ncbi:Phosphatidylethanolamine-binding protein 1 [Balamuthia mandrillaris]
MEEATSHRIVPDLVSELPRSLLKVSFHDGEEGQLTLSPGTELRPQQVRQVPRLRLASSSAAEAEGGRSSALYTVMLVDPDAPSPLDPKFKAWLHWLAVNVPLSSDDDELEPEKGFAIAEYVGAAPGKDSGKHRYTFLVYEQPGVIDVENETVIKSRGCGFAPRRSFQPSAFQQKHGLSSLLAFNMFYAEWDESVPASHKLILGEE